MKYVVKRVAEQEINKEHTMKFKLSKHDSENWSIQRWREGGREIKTGFAKGKTVAAGWLPADKFYPSLPEATRGLFRMATLAVAHEGYEIDLEAIQKIVRAAETETDKALDQLMERARGMEESAHE